MIKPICNSYYQHRYGGIYRVDKPLAFSTVDKTELVVYTHVWPFEAHTWVRPLSEWEDGRFRLLEEGELTKFLDRDVMEFREEITLAKEAAKRDK